MFIGEDLPGAGDRLGVHRVADPVAGFGVLVPRRVGQHGEDLGRRCGDGAGGDERSSVVMRWLLCP